MFFNFQKYEMLKTWIEVKDYLLLHSSFSFLEGSSNKLIYLIIILLMCNIHGGFFFLQSTGEALSKAFDSGPENGMIMFFYKQYTGILFIKDQETKESETNVSEKPQPLIQV